MAEQRGPIDPTWSLTLEDLDDNRASMLDLPPDVRRVIQRETELPSSTRVRRGRVILLPGIMGSRLRRGSDLIWLDPRDLLSNGLGKAERKPGDGIEADGVLALPYLRVQRRLRQRGWTVDTFPYDWRQSLDDLGKRLAQYLGELPDSSVHLVCHSMGGLVARAAMIHPEFAKVGRVVQLATPNRGSFKVVLTYLGSERLVAGLEAFNPSFDMAGVVGVLGSFAGLTQMLPFGPRTPDFLSSSWWTGPFRPLDAELNRAGEVQQAIPQPDERFTIIAGYGEDTIVDIIDDGSRRIRNGLGGDGTVPLSSAVLPNMRAYYAKAGHTFFARDSDVIDATDDILRTGATKQLPNQWPVDRRGPGIERELEAYVPSQRVTQADLDRSEFIAGMFREFIVPLSLADELPIERIFTPKLDQVIIARRRQRRLEIQLMPGNLTDVATRAWAVGIFSHVDPGGAARVVDACLNGALSDITSRRMVATTPGSLFLLPTGRHPVFADVVALCGLGGFEAFDASAHETASGNLTRTLVRAGIEEYATVLLGAGSGFSPEAMLEAHLSGVLGALADVDPRGSFRRIVFCEVDDVRFATMRSALLALASGPLFDGVEVTLDELPAPARRWDAQVVEQGASWRSDVYLTIQERGRSNGKLDWRFSVLSPGGAATVFSDNIEIAEAKLQDLLERAKAIKFAEPQEAWGLELGGLVLPPEIARVLQQSNLRQTNWTIIHDTSTAQVPWESLVFGAFAPATAIGISRRYDGPKVSIARWSQHRLVDEYLDILLVVPDEDLGGAEEEAALIMTLPKTHPQIRVWKISGEEATIEIVSAELASGKYDVFHYAGHAAFDEQSRRSWLELRNGHLDGTRLATIRSLPMLAVLNACESARISALHPLERRNVLGLAETFLIGGIGHFVGTHWPVDDRAAKCFAVEFYPRILEGQTIGQATRLARLAVRNADLRDWANFVHWGASDAEVKARPGIRGR